MKKTIKTLQDALTYHLQGMLYAEGKVKNEFMKCRHHISSDGVKQVIQTYLNNTENVN